MSFYVTLPSDSSMAYFPRNSLSRFITYLPEEIKLNGDYEVGLCEFSYPRTWFNVKKDSAIRVWSKKQPGSSSLAYNLHETVIIIPPGYYSTPLDLIEMINASLDSTMEFKYNNVTKRVTVTLKEYMQLDIPINLALMLGFTLDANERSIEVLETTKAPYVADMNAGLHTLFIYSDVVTLNTLGDTSVNILRLISVKGKDGETIDAVFIKPHYAPVASRQFRTIEINVMDDVGNPVEFQRGKVHATLHFRPRRSWAPL